jgi:hypothetical protein
MESTNKTPEQFQSISDLLPFMLQQLESLHKNNSAILKHPTALSKFICFFNVIISTAKMSSLASLPLLTRSSIQCIGDIITDKQIHEVFRSSGLQVSTYTTIKTTNNMFHFYYYIIIFPLGSFYNGVPFKI